MSHGKNMKKGKNGKNLKIEKNEKRGKQRKTEKKEQEFNYLLVIAYDGSGFNGWQLQKTGRTVQGEITNAINAIFKTRIILNGSGRTDGGVHAHGQTASFKMPVQITGEKLKNILNVSLPTDIAILAAYEVDPSFHARYHAVGKTYIYKMRNGRYPNPFDARYSYFIPYSLMTLDVEKMRKAANVFIGTHDFKGFMATGSPKSNTVRTIMEIEIQADYSPYAPLERESRETADADSASEDRPDNRIEIKITGSGFLYKMVRIIAGALVEVGAGKAEPEDLLLHLKEGKIDRKKAVAPSAGLYLSDVYYD